MIPLLPLKFQRPIEGLKSWEGISTPADLIKVFASLLSVDVNSLLNFEEVIYSDIEPTGEASKKIWIKTDEPVGIGIPTGEEYTMLYKYPVNIPFLWAAQEVGFTYPSYIRELTDGEYEGFNITKPQAKFGAWVIMNL